MIQTITLSQTDKEVIYNHDIVVIFIKVGPSFEQNRCKGVHIYTTVKAPTVPICTVL